MYGSGIVPEAVLTVWELAAAQGPVVLVRLLREKGFELRFEDYELIVTPPAGYSRSLPDAVRLCEVIDKNEFQIVGILLIEEIVRNDALDFDPSAPDIADTDPEFLRQVPCDKTIN